MVSIVIVSWNSREYLARCLRSIQHWVTYDHEIIVVDNASGDGSPDFVARSFPKVRLIRNDQNFSFAHASNQGMRVATGRFVVLLNPDTELIEEPFQSMIATSRADQSIACVGPELVNEDRSHQPSVRHFPRLADQTVILLKLRPLLQWLPLMKRYMTEPPPGTGPTDVEQIMGAVMLIPRAALEAIGLFDELYPNWFEEVDWCTRARQAGWRVVYDRGTKIVHTGGTSFRQVLTIKKQRWLLTGLRRYAAKNWSKKDRLVLSGVIPVSIILSYIQLVIKPR